MPLCVFKRWSSQRERNSHPYSQAAGRAGRGWNCARPPFYPWCGGITPRLHPPAPTNPMTPQSLVCVGGGGGECFDYLLGTAPWCEVTVPGQRPLPLRLRLLPGRPPAHLTASDQLCAPGPHPAPQAGRHPQGLNRPTGRGHPLQRPRRCSTWKHFPRVPRESGAEQRAVTRGSVTSNEHGLRARTGPGSQGCG